MKIESIVPHTSYAASPDERDARGADVKKELENVFDKFLAVQNSAIEELENRAIKDPEKSAIQELDLRKVGE